LTTGAKILENSASFFFHRSGYGYVILCPASGAFKTAGIWSYKIGAHSGIGMVMIVGIFGDGVTACEYDERHYHIKFPDKFEPEPFNL
jgi:hypothetical protein